MCVHMSICSMSVCVCVVCMYMNVCVCESVCVCSYVHICFTVHEHVETRNVFLSFLSSGVPPYLSPQQAFAPLSPCDFLCLPGEMAQLRMDCITIMPHFCTKSPVSSRLVLVSSVVVRSQNVPKTLCPRQVA